MQGFCANLFSGAAFAGHKHGRICWRRTFDDPVNCLHGRRLADKIADYVRGLILWRRHSGLGSLIASDGMLHGIAEPVGAERLDKEIASAGADDVNRQAHRAIGRHDNRFAGMLGANAAHKVKSGHVRQFDIENEAGKLRDCGQRQCLFAAARQAHVATDGRQKGAVGLGQRNAVFDDQNANRLHKSLHATMECIPFNG